MLRFHYAKDASIRRSTHSPAAIQRNTHNTNRYFIPFFFCKQPPIIFSENAVTYYLFNRTNPNDYLFLTSANLNSTKSNIFLIHGWTESRNKTWYEDLKNALLQKFDVNVIQVDYSKPASNRYPIAVLLSKSVANIISKFILQISNVNLQNVTLIGHSLGGQVAGFVGKEIFAATNKKIGKIIALDPAGPLFTFKTQKNRLSSDDATVVEVIHTDRILGYYQNAGDVDFYINPSRNVQPGCESLDLMAAGDDSKNDLFSFC